MKLVLTTILLVLFVSIKTPKNYLILKTNKKDECGYADSKGHMIIPFGKYPRCFTDTFKNFAIVEKPKRGFVVIDRNENVKYNVFIFDNGPDDIQDDLFRIIENGQIGYADSNFSIRIKPQYGCAFPFEHGIAKVSYNCKTETDPQIHEHHVWISKNWFYINKQGKRVKN